MPVQSRRRSCTSSPTGPPPAGISGWGWIWSGKVVIRAEGEGSIKVDSRCIESELVSSHDLRLEQLIGMLTVKEKDLLAHIALLTLQDPGSPLTMEILFHSAQMRMRVTAALFHQWVRKFILLGLISFTGGGVRSQKGS
jgi:hypothetical protein